MEKNFMVRNMTLSVMLLVGCVWCIALVSRADSAQNAVSNTFKPAISVHHLMEGQNLIFTQLNDAIDNKELPRRTHVIEGLAFVLAELANVNTMNSDQDDYRGWAAELRDNAIALAHEADKKKDADEKKLLRGFNRLKRSCISCHNEYQD